MNFGYNKCELNKLDGGCYEKKKLINVIYLSVFNLTK